MDIKDILEIGENASKRSNKDLLDAATTLTREFEDTKDLLIKLSYHLDVVESAYFKVSTEIKNRQSQSDNG